MEENRSEKVAKDFEARIREKHKNQKKINAKCVAGIFIILITTLSVLALLIYGFPEWAIQNRYFVATIPILMFIAIFRLAYTNDQNIRKISERCPACGLRFKTCHTGKILENGCCPKCNHALE